MYSTECYLTIYHAYQYYKFFLNPPSELKLKNGDLILIKNIEKYKPTGYQYGIDLPKEDWSKATIDDVMNLENVANIYNILLPEADQKKFQEKYLPQFQKKLSQILTALSGNDFSAYPSYYGEAANYLASISTIRTPEARKKELLAEYLSKIKRSDLNKLKETTQNLEFIKRASAVIAGFQNVSSTIATNELTKQSEYEEIQKTINENLAPDVLLTRILEKNKTYVSGQSGVLKDYYISVLLLKIIDQNLQIKPEFIDLFSKVAFNPASSYNLALNEIRWTLPVNITNKEVDFSNAIQMDGQLNNLAQSKRLSTISKGDKILSVTSTEGTFVLKGGKKLKMKLKEKGSIEKDGNKILFGLDTIYADLLEIEKIIALSVLNPIEVLNILKKKGIKTDKLKKMPQLINKNYEYARQLADTAIELIYNFDPRMARRLIKEFGV